MEQYTKLSNIRLKESATQPSKSIIPALAPKANRKHNRIPEKIKFQMSKYLSGDNIYAAMTELELIKILEDKFNIPISIPTFRLLAENFEITYLHKEEKPTAPDEDLITCINYIFTIANLPKIDALTRLNKGRIK